MLLHPWCCTPGCCGTCCALSGVGKGVCAASAKIYEVFLSLGSSSGVHVHVSVPSSLVSHNGSTHATSHMHHLHLLHVVWLLVLRCVCVFFVHRVTHMWALHSSMFMVVQVVAREKGDCWWFSEVVCPVRPAICCLLWRRQGSTFRRLVVYGGRLHGPVQCGVQNQGPGHPGGCGDTFWPRGFVIPFVTHGL